MLYIFIMLFGGIFGTCFIKNLLTTVIQVYKTAGMNFTSGDLSVIICGGLMSIICLIFAVIGAICVLEALIRKVRKYNH